MPFQAYIPDGRSMDFEYVERVFVQSTFNSYCGLSNGDTIVLLSGGVVAHISEAVIAEFIVKSFQEEWTPDQLAESIVASAVTSMTLRMMPADATCTVGYVCEHFSPCA